MWKQTLAAVLLALSLVACKEEPINPNSGQIVGVGDVRIVKLQVVGTGESASNANSGQLYYVVAQLELTNNEHQAFTPDPSRFFFTDKFAARAQGLDQGSSVLVGVSNSRQPLKVGEKHVYTIAFRTTDGNPLGQITYEP